MINAGAEYGGLAYSGIPLPMTDGYSEVLFTPWCRDLFVQVVVTGLQSGESITGRVEGSLDGSSWDNLNAADADTTISESGSSLLSYTGALPPYVRVQGFEIDATELATATITGYIAILS